MGGMQAAAKGAQSTTPHCLRQASHAKDRSIYPPFDGALDNPINGSIDNPFDGSLENPLDGATFARA